MSTSRFAIWAPFRPRRVRRNIGLKRWVAVLLLAMAIVSATLWIFRRLRFLEDFIRICAWCRKVEVADQWVSFEDYMKLQRREIDPWHLPGMPGQCLQTAGQRVGVCFRLVGAFLGNPIALGGMVS